MFGFTRRTQKIESLPQKSADKPAPIKLSIPLSGSLGNGLPARHAPAADDVDQPSSETWPQPSPRATPTPTFESSSKEFQPPELIIRAPDEAISNDSATPDATDGMALLTKHEIAPSVTHVKPNMHSVTLPAKHMDAAIQFSFPPIANQPSPSAPTVASHPIAARSHGSGAASSNPTIPGPARQFAPTKAPSVTPEVYEDIRHIPRGLYESFDRLDMPQTFKDGFALITSSTGKGFLLVAVEMWGSPLHLEVGNRIKKRHPDLQITPHKATGEVIRTLHHQNASNGSNRLVDQTDIERFAWKLIDDAVAQQTSDIHIETRDSFAQVFFRIFGERVEQATIATESALALCNVLYGFHADSSSKKTSWTPSEVLDTSIEHETSNGTRIQIRFSSAPIHPSPNFHVVCRLLVMDVSRTPALEDIGYTNAQVRAIEDMLVGAQGLVVLVGPTNSGKSTSMQAFARRIRQNRGESIKLITVEDPVEYLISGACQMGVPHGRKQLEDKSGSVFNTLLKGTLRQDPDAVIVGEIRDKESCSAVKDLVLAGRKLLSTLHVFEAMAVYARLRELGLPESILYMSNFITGVIYQRLVPTLCPHCSIPIEEARTYGMVSHNVYERVAKAVNLESCNVRIRNPEGCSECGERGVIGRTACAEMIVPDEIFLEHMRTGNLSAARAHWNGNVDLNVNGFGVSAVAHAISKMILGQVDPHDVESQIGMIKIDANASLSDMHVSYLAGKVGRSVPAQSNGPRPVAMGRRMSDAPGNRMANLYEARR